MNLQTVVATLKKLGLLGGPTVLVWLQFGLPLLILVLGFVIGRAKLKKKVQEKGAKAPAPNDSKRSQPQYELYKAWRRFLRRLPAVFRRSILNFDQIVVLGASGSGKSWLVDSFTDWRKQTRQFAGGDAYDPELQVYLTSYSVITEIPAWVLEDHSEKCRGALSRLWRSLYRRREPTVVVTIDTERLKGTADEVVAYAEALRAKINVLAGVRKRPIEVRLAVTRLDRFEGYAAFAEFCREQCVSSRLRLSSPDTSTADELSRWLEEIRGHLPRALTTSSSVDFRRVVTFVRQLPTLTPSLALFIETLFASDPLSRTPRCGGIFLALSPVGPDNPLERNPQAEAAPDPRRRHWMLATVGASVILGYLVLAYRAQWELWHDAREALGAYDPAGDREEEREARETITRFAYKENGILYRHPAFFEKAATATRAELSRRIRENLLVPRLREVAVRGTTEKDSLMLPRRRSLYYLAVIHSDRDDRHKFTEDRRSVVESMTGLDPDLIADFIRSTDHAYVRPVSFEIGATDLDPLDDPSVWLSFFSEVEKVVKAGVVSPKDLESLQTRAAQLSRAVRRFEHDAITVDLLDRLLPRGRADSRASLSEVYKPKFERLLRNLTHAKLHEQREQIRAALEKIKGDDLAKDNVTLLTDLVARLNELYPEEGTDPEPSDGDQTIVVRIGEVETKFDVEKWGSLIRDSRASFLVGQFMRNSEPERSIFFQADDEQLPPVVWNLTNDGTSLFTGSGRIDGRYTRAAFNEKVRKPIVQLAEVLDRAKIPEAQKLELVAHIRGHLRDYAAEYRGQLRAFYKSYGVNARSQEALRVVLAQIASDQSPLLDFLTAVARNTLLDTQHPMLEPMREAVSEFEPLHAVVGNEGATNEFAKYRAIAGQLLADLRGADDADKEANDAGAATAESLAGELSPAGRIELANLRRDAGSYSELIAEWLSSVALLKTQFEGDKVALQAPFQAPFDQLARLGRQNIEDVVARIWQQHVKPDLVAIWSKFPFDAAASEEVTPRELTSVLHPHSGKVFEVFRRYFEPLVEVRDGVYRERRDIRGKLTFPSDLFSMMSRAATLSGRFWNQAGEATPLTFRVATVPFEHGPNPNAALTLVYLNAGESSVFNFNQKPGIVSVSLDWTKQNTSQVGIQLTNLETKENIFPEPIVVEGSFWSFLRLLKKAEDTRLKQAANARVYSWPIRHRREGAERTVARFVIFEDPLDLLGIPRETSRELVVGAVN